MSSTISRSGRTWQVGTLTYSLGGLTALFCWLLWGDLAWSVRDRAIPGVMQLLFGRFGASDFTVGVLFASLPAALGVIIGPVVGYNSDRLRTRLGRRIPFLIGTTPFVVLAVAALAFSPQLGGQLHRFLGPHSPGLNPCVLIVLGFLWTVFEVALITASSVFGALINDVVPQEILGRFFGLMRAVSLVVGIVFSFWLMGEAKAHFALIFLGVAVIYGAGFTLMCFRVREGEYPPPPRVPGGAQNPLAAIRAYFKDGFGHSYYLWYFAATILSGMATGPVNVYSVFYAQAVSMSMADYGKCLGVTYVFSLCLSYPLGVLTDRFHPLRLSILVLILYVGAMAYGFLCVHDARVFGIALVLHGVAAGTFGTVSASLSQRLLPRAKYAEIGSAGGILGSLAGIGMPPLLGTFLDYTHHDYRYTFLAGLVLAAAAVVAYLILYRRFLALGGPAHYRAPE
jgi:MFS family permease